MNIEININDCVLTTERVKLRQWKQSDLDDFYEYASVDGVGQMAGWAPHNNKQISQQILDMFIEGKHTFAIEYNSKVIGSLGIEKYDEKILPEFIEKRCCEIGYVLSKDYWGKGLMPEAVNRVIEYLFEEMNVDVIFCGHFIWNEQSHIVQKKCGFNHYKFAEYETLMGTTEQEEINILYKNEYKKTGIN